MASQCSFFLNLASAHALGRTVLCLFTMPLCVLLDLKESVIRYIEDNMQLLLSLALDHWFAHTNITYTGKEQLVADETLISYRDKITDELRVSGR